MFCESRGGGGGHVFKGSKRGMSQGLRGESRFLRDPKEGGGGKKSPVNWNEDLQTPPPPHKNDTFLKEASNIPYQPLLIKPVFSVLAHAEKQVFSKLVFQYIFIIVIYCTHVIIKCRWTYMYNSKLLEALYCIIILYYFNSIQSRWGVESALPPPPPRVFSS